MISRFSQPLFLAALCLLAVGLPTVLAGQPNPPTFSFQRSWHGGLQSPHRLAFDAAGMLYISDPGGQEIVARSADGRIFERRGGIGRPLGIAFDSADRILVGDAGDGSVTAYDRSWRPQYQLGIGAGEFSMPADLSVEPLSGRIYVVDPLLEEVRAYDSSGAFELAFNGSGSLDGPLRFPTGVHALEAAGQVVVVDHQNRRVRVFTQDGIQISSFGEHGDLPGEIYGPQGMWVDGAGRLFLADSRLGRITVFDLATGNFLGSTGDVGIRPGELRLPMDVAMDEQGRLFVAAADNRRLEVFGIDGAADPEAFVPAEAEVSVDASSTPPQLLAILTLPGYRAEDIDAATLSADGVLPLSATPGDHDGDHQSDLRAAFDFDQILAVQTDGRPDLLFEGALTGGLRFEVTGRIPGLIFFDGFESGDVSSWSAALGNLGAPVSVKGARP